MVAVEPIPNEDHVSRHVEFPRTYDSAKDLILDTVFEFANGSGESVVWRKYAPSDQDVHILGCAWEKQKRNRKPEMSYAGFIPAEVASVRAIRTVRGHAFEVKHVPDEGIHHAEVEYKPANEASPSTLERVDKLELRFALRTVFRALVPHQCSA